MMTKNRTLKLAEIENRNKKFNISFAEHYDRH